MKAMPREERDVLVLRMAMTLYCAPSVLLHSRGGARPWGRILVQGSPLWLQGRASEPLGFLLRNSHPLDATSEHGHQARESSGLSQPPTHTIHSSLLLIGRSRVENITSQVLFVNSASLPRVWGWGAPLAGAELRSPFVPGLRHRSQDFRGSSR